MTPITKTATRASPPAMPSTALQPTPHAKRSVSHRKTPPPPNPTPNQILIGDARSVLATLPAESVDLSFWSPPYYVGKSYEQDLTFEGWQELLQGVVAEHHRLLRPGGFMAVNIGDILCFADPEMPRFQANLVRGKTRSVTKQDVLAMQAKHPQANRHQLAELLGCSEQTVQRRLEGNNVRGGKQNAGTKVVLTGCLVAEWAEQAGLYLYDQRIWHKDPCWANSQWHSVSYRAVDEFEHVYVFWKPGVVEYDRSRLARHEWAEWGSRGVWQIKSVARNDRHEAEFPEELAERVIRLFSPPGGLVIDPFVGSGTTTAVAKSLGRNWLGIELDEKSARLAQQRTAGATAPKLQFDAAVALSFNSDTCHQRQPTVANWLPCHAKPAYNMKLGEPR